MRFKMPSFHMFILCVALLCSYTKMVNAEDQELISNGSFNSLPQSLGYNGSMSYVIDIKVPVGRANLAPALKLAYNSNGKNGWVGVGWDLTAGAIQRSTKNGICYDCDDYTINGETEIIRRSDWGGGYYGAIIEDAFTRYFFNSVNGGWEATHKNGVKYFYGVTASSRQANPNNPDEVFKWCLEKILDPNGNSISFYYYKDQGQIYIDNIKYVNVGSEYANRVEFVRESRTDAPISYKTHFAVKTAYRLASIRALSNDQLVRKYELSYDPDSVSTNRSLLSSVTQYGNNEQLALPPVKFKYSTAGNNFIEPDPASPGIPTDISGWQTRNNTPQNHSIGDFNGDGLSDFMYVPNNGDGRWLVAYSTGTGFTLPDYNNPALPTAINGWQTRNLQAQSQKLGDFNGDGLSDFMYVPNNGDGRWLVAYSTGTGFTLPDYDNPALPTAINGWQTRNNIPQSQVVADFNGDGLSDYMYVPNNGDGRWLVAYSTGTGFTLPDYNNPALPTAINGWQTRNNIFQSQLFSDFNSDGLTDYMYVPNNGDGRWLIAYSTGESFTLPDYNNPVLPAEINGWQTRHNKWNCHLLGDFSGDGKPDFMWVPNNGDGRWLVAYTDGPYPDLISQIDNSVGATYNFAYSPSTQHSKIYLPFILQTLTSIIIKDLINNQEQETIYAYGNAFYNRDDRDFRGYKTVIQTNPNGTTQKTVFYQGRLEAGDPDDSDDNYYLKSRVNYVEARESASGNLISRTDLTYGQRDEGNGSQFVYLDEKVTQTYENGALVVETHEDPISYDAVGNLESIEYWDTDSSAEKIIKTFGYTNYGSETDLTWRRTMEQVSGAVSGTVRETTYEYTTDGRANLLRKEINNNIGANQVSYFKYDDYGNLTHEWSGEQAQFHPDESRASVSYQYGTSNTYPEIITNCAGHSITKTWDERFGKVSGETDPNGNSTIYTFDPFGRQDVAFLPNEGEVHAEYHDDTYPRWVKKQVQESAGSFIDTWEYYDGLGRTIQTVSMGVNENGEIKPVVMRTFYDNMGRVKETFGPFFVDSVQEGGLHPVPDGNVPHAWTDYDIRSRPRYSHTNDGQHGTITVETIYNGLEATVIDPDGGQKTTIEDYLGRMVEVIEHTETGQLHTNYKYNAAGDLLEVIDALNNPTTMTYNTLGQKLTMNDPDMGYWEYRYDLDGNLSWQKDAKLQEIEFDYDCLGRILEKRYLNPGPNDYNVTNTYDDASITLSNAIGNLSKQTNGQVTTWYRDYDEMGNLVTMGKQIIGDSQERQTGYSYDMAGRIVDMAYPDSYQVHYVYYPGTGLMHQVYGISDFKNYITYEGYTPSAKTRHMAFGNGVHTEYAYDDFSARLTNIKSKNSISETLIDKSYTYTQAGDIEAIDDAVSPNTRFYVYDKLHRLTSEYSSNDDYSYLTPSIMSYNYNPNDKPLHAVSSIDSLGNNVPFEYDANGNMISGSDMSNPEAPATRAIAYNADNMPVQITHSIYGPTNFEYDGGQTRAKKINAANVAYYFGAHFEIINGQQVKYIFAGDQRIAQVKNGQIHYFHKDYLGSSTVMTNEAEDVIQQAEYLPFGGIRGGEGLTASNYGFTDQERDSESGLYNYGARLYDPVIGQFITPDSIVQNPFDPQTLNRYSYCRNNPLVYVDPDGHIFGFVVGALIGAVVSGAQSDWDFGTMCVGALIGGISGGTFSGVEGAVSGSLSSAVQSGAMSSTTSGLISGAAGGAAAGTVSGGLGAAFYGGDIGEGMLTGFLTGAVGGGVFGGLEGHFGNTWDMWRVGASTVAGGGISELAGGDFWQGASLAFAFAGARYLYNKIVPYDATWERGGPAVAKRSTDLPVAGANNIGTQQGGPLNVNGLWNEGGRVSRFVNQVPGINAVAGMHDVFQVALDSTLGNLGRSFLNVPGMIPAAAISYSGLMADSMSISTYLSVQELNDYR